jgi:pyruvate dehydrogenase E2 component (dihydrolipoamide acetyltransferase)
MANEVKLPRLGQGMEAGTIVKWLKSEGDRVEKGEPLYELDTDKVTQEVEAEASGVLLKIAVSEGEVPVGQTIAVIGEEGEDVLEVDGSGAAREVEEREEEEGSPGPQREPERELGREGAADQSEQEKEIKAPVAQRDGGRVKASPLARRIARERGIDLAALSGTGPEGRIVAEDVERAGAQPAPVAAPTAAPGEVEVEQLSSVRRTIARRLTEAWQAPAFQIAMSADMTRSRELHRRLVELAEEEGTKPTLTDVLTKACAAALMRHRAVNARFAGDSIERHPSADIGLAVAIPDGLVVPVIRGCEHLTIAQLAAARADVVGRARGGKLKQDDLEGGTFTVSNLGMYGVEQFVAVLNPPQAAILAVGAVEERPAAQDDDVVVRPLMTMTLTCDHRALDGATASDFLRSVKSFLEEPGLML